MCGDGSSLRWALLLALVLLPTPAAAQRSSEPLTLAQALERARQTAPDSAAGRARAEAARLAAAAASRLPNPVFEFRQENWLSGVTRDVLPLDTFAEVTQLIEIGGKREARRRVAEAQAETAGAEAALVERTVLRDVSRTFLEAIRQRERQRTLSAGAV